MQDCDESSLSMSDDEYQLHKSGGSVKRDALLNKEVMINRNNQLENMSQNLGEKYHTASRKRGRH